VQGGQGNIVRKLIHSNREWLDENNIVTEVIVGKNTTLLSDRKNELHLTAGIGYTYDSERDAFIPPKPFASWLLDENTCWWNAPIPYPTDIGTEENPKLYSWDEATTSWVESE
jgi:hypothetical protein